MELKYFRAFEFECRCGNCTYGFPQMDETLLKQLDTARHHAATPFVITSPVRCPDHNRKVGGVDDSSHTKGHAVDIAVRNSHARFRILKALIHAGFERIGIYPSFIHVDNDPDLPPEVCWHV